MSSYDDYIARLCRTGKYTEEEARDFALSKGVEKHYRESESGKVVVEKSAYMPMGECK